MMMAKPGRTHRNSSTTTSPAGIALFLVLCSPLGCTDGDQGTEQDAGSISLPDSDAGSTITTTPADMTVTTPKDMDMAQGADAVSDMEVDAGGERDLSGCTDASCVFAFETFGSCTQVLNLGVLDASTASRRTYYANTRMLDSELSASCAQNGEQSLEFTFAYQVSATAQLRLDISPISNVDWVMTRATGSCDNEVRCREEDDSFFANAGVQYFVSAEPLSVGGGAEFRLNIDVEPVNCAQTGSVCRDDVLVTCSRGEEVELPCGNSCTNMSSEAGSSVLVGRCDANDCATAEEVPNMGTTRFTGTWGGYQNTFRGPSVPI
ncbi:MAG: hypothetical protein AAGI01_09965, partial [Myxococcota bacterium]